MRYHPKQLRLLRSIPHDFLSIIPSSAIEKQNLLRIFSIVAKTKTMKIFFMVAKINPMKS